MNDDDMDFEGPEDDKWLECYYNAPKPQTLTEMMWEKMFFDR